MNFEIPSARSASKPRWAFGSDGSLKTYGAPPSESAPQVSPGLASAPWAAAWPAVARRPAQASREQEVSQRRNTAVLLRGDGRAGVERTGVCKEVTAGG